MSMFCFQCEATSKGTGCTLVGVCGKDAQTAALQDLLVYAVKDISRYAHRASQLGARDRDVDVFTVEALFSTLTNVNFDPLRFGGFMDEAAEMRGRVQKLYEKAANKAGQTWRGWTAPFAGGRGATTSTRWHARAAKSGSISASRSSARRPPACRN